MSLMFDPVNHRRHPRLALPAAYTHVQARREAGRGFDLEGHAYDISRSGMRLEFDEAVEPGAELMLRIHLPRRPSPFPGAGSVPAAGADFEVAAVVVRRHEEEEFGPVRIGVVFRRFRNAEDERTLLDYLSQAGIEPPHPSAAAA